MPVKQNRTYGKKKSALPSSKAIFAFSSSPSLSNQEELEIAIERGSKQDSGADDRSLNHLTKQEQHDLVSNPPTCTDSLSTAFSSLEINNGSPLTSSPEIETFPEKSSTTTEDQTSPLYPLLSLSNSDGLPISLESWDSILPQDCTLSKIAEASFAEVYRITTSSATSIVKIMPLKIPSDALSMNRTYASHIADVVPELRIMNVLTEIPGFVQFKGARIVTGKQSEKFVEAWEEWAGETEDGTEWNSDFEHPAAYEKEAKLLAIELGDAGEVLEDVIVDSIDKFWDIFIGAVIALARAEAMHEFEHRDLHENNICVFSHPPPHRIASNEGPIFGRSGLEVTIIDYGLSRAVLTDNHITFKDLETDLEIFRGKKWHRQFEVYRQMRSHLYTGTTEALPLTWHKNDASAGWMQAAGRSWADHTPLSNSLWISYLFYYLSTQYAKHGPGRKADNKRDIDLVSQDLESRLDFALTKRGDKDEDWRFFNAGECLDYCVQRGWIAENQLAGESSDIEHEQVDDKELETEDGETLLERQLNGLTLDHEQSPQQKTKVSYAEVRAKPREVKATPSRIRTVREPAPALCDTPSTTTRILRPRNTPSVPTSPTKGQSLLATQPQDSISFDESQTHSPHSRPTRSKKPLISNSNTLSIQVMIPAKTPAKVPRKKKANHGASLVTKEASVIEELVPTPNERKTRGRQKALDK